MFVIKSLSFALPLQGIRLSSSQEIKAFKGKEQYAQLLSLAAHRILIAVEGIHNK